MIPTTLPAPAAPTAVERATGPSAANGDDFDRTFDGAVGRGDRARGATDHPPQEPDGGRPEEPGADGREQALGAMPAGAPARVVVSGQAHDARPASRPEELPTTAATAAAAAGAVDLTDLGPEAPSATSTADATAAEAADTVTAEPHPAGAGGDVTIDVDPDGVETAGGVDLTGDGSVDPGTDTTSAAAGPLDGGSGDEIAIGSREAATAVRREPTSGDGDDAPVVRGAEPSAARTSTAPGRDVASEHAARPSTTAPEVAPQGESVAAPAPPTTVSGTAAVTGSTPPAPAAPPAMVEQLVAHVTPLAEGADGTHELTIELRPAELGAVRLEVTLDDGVLSVRVHAEDPASRRLLAQSLGDLRHALADAGISAGSLDVGDPHAGTGARDPDADGRGSSAGRGGDRPPATDVPRPARGRASSTSAVDVLL